MELSMKILQKEKVKRDVELSKKFEEFLAFTRENGIVSLENQGGNIVLERLTRLSTALTEAQLNALNAKADYEATKSMQNEPAKVKQFASASSAVGVRVFVSDTETTNISRFIPSQKRNHAEGSNSTIRKFTIKLLPS